MGCQISQNTCEVFQDRPEIDEWSPIDVPEIGEKEMCLEVINERVVSREVEV